MPGPHPARPPFDVAALGRVPAWLLVVAITALAALVVFAAFPPRPQILHVLQKLGHPSVFGLIALASLGLLRRRAGAARGVVTDYLTAFGICLLLGGTTELLQIWTHRDPALRDVGLDARGALCALALGAAFDARAWPVGRRALARGGYALAALALAALILAPLAWSVAAYGYRAHRFPVLADAASDLALYFVQADGLATPRRVAVPSAAGAPRYAVEIPLGRQPYGGLELTEPEADWRGYQELDIELTNPGNALVACAVRVDDRIRSPAYPDRYTAEFRLEPRVRTSIRIRFDELRTPAGRALDLSSIARVFVFYTGPRPGRPILLNRVSLR
jgi:hypothetical protein